MIEMHMADCTAYWTLSGVGTPQDACGSPCCVFDQDAFWYQGALGPGSDNPCDPAYWRPAPDCDVLDLPDSSDVDCRDRGWRNCRPPLVAAWSSVTDRERSTALDSFKIRLRGVAVVGAELLLAEAVAILRDSIDIARWCCCLYLGPDSDACSCILDEIRDELKFVFTNETSGSDGDALMWVSGYGDNSITINAHEFAVYVDDFLNGQGTVVDYTPIFIASVILHEIVHTCVKDSAHPKEAPGVCDVVDSMDECFRRSAIDRYMGATA